MLASWNIFSNVSWMSTRNDPWLCLLAEPVDVPTHVCSRVKKVLHGSLLNKQTKKAALEGGNGKVMQNIWGSSHQICPKTLVFSFMPSSLSWLLFGSRRRGASHDRTPGFPWIPNTWRPDMRPLPWAEGNPQSLPLQWIGIHSLLSSFFECVSGIFLDVMLCTRVRVPHKHT